MTKEQERIMDRTPRTGANVFDPLGLMQLQLVCVTALLQLNPYYQAFQRR